MEIKTFIILGMHRSTTSLLANALHEFGISMGNVVNKAKPYGLWEDRDFFTLNRRILKLAGGHWDDPPSREKILYAGENQKRVIKRVIRKNNRKGVNWGFKDPRTVLTIECYMPYLVNPIFYVCFRDPNEVAVSLKKRNKFPIEKGVALANEYNSRLLFFLNKLRIGGYKQWEQ